MMNAKRFRFTAYKANGDYKGARYCGDVNRLLQWAMREIDIEIDDCEKKYTITKRNNVTTIEYWSDNYGFEYISAAETGYSIAEYEKTIETKRLAEGIRIDNLQEFFENLEK